MRTGGRQRRRTARPRGFTLIEAITSVIVVGILVVVVYQGLSLMVRTAGFIRQKSEACDVAQRHLEEQIATWQWLNGDQSGDDSPNDDPSRPAMYHWTVSTTDYSEYNGSGDLHLVSCDVTWTSHGQQYSVSLSTAMYDQEKQPVQTAAQ